MPQTWFHRLRARMNEAPGLDYLMIRTIVAVLTGIGLLMVTSASVTWSIYDNNPVWGESLRQVLYVAVGLVVFWVALRIPPSQVKRFSWLFLLLSLGLLLAVLLIGTGDDEFGSRSWLVIGNFQLQPSEFAKFGFAMWGAAFISQSFPNRPTTREYGWLAVVGLLFVSMILAEGDTGMALTFLVVVFALYFFTGISYRVIMVLVGVVVAGVLTMIFQSGGYRFARVRTYLDGLDGTFDNQQSVAFQSYQGYLSLADGGWLGVGIGQSRAKWFYLPEAKNDFIFAIIGEELGVVGALLVIVLYTALAYFGLRTALHAANRFQALLAATVTTAVVIQAFINIGYVVGIFPVTGIQLPLISAGGTSAVVTLGAMGLLANIARHEPEQVSYMAAHGRPFFDRILLLPEPYNDPREEREARQRAERKKRPPRSPVTRLSRVPHADADAERIDAEYDAHSVSELWRHKSGGSVDYSSQSRTSSAARVTRAQRRETPRRTQPGTTTRRGNYRTPPRSER